MFTQLSHASLRKTLREHKAVQTDLLVFLYFVSRWRFAKDTNGKKKMSVAYLSCADIVKGTGVHPSSAKASAERLVKGGFLIANKKTRCSSAQVYALNHAFIYQRYGD